MKKVTIFFDKIFSLSESFKLSVINLAVPSAVFKAILPVKPSVTITLDFHPLFYFPLYIH